jgi:glycosyltransferase involved in cell wall biosynthesis
MRLCLINSSFYPAIIYGGPTYATYYLAKFLAATGVEVRVSTTNRNGKERLKVKTNVDHFFQTNFYVKYYHDTILGRFSLQLMVFLWRDIKKADVVHTQDIFSIVSLFALFYGWVFRKPILVSPRGVLSKWALNQGFKFKRTWLKWLIGPFQGYAVFHATSQLEADDIRGVFPQARVVVVPNGIDLSAFTNPQACDLNGWLASRMNCKANFSPFIISLSRLHAIKGYEKLLLAFADLKSPYPKAALLLAGHDDGELATLNLQAQQLGIDQQVFFVGHLDGPEKVAFLAAGDVFVLPSFSENFGNVYLEALAAGTPIVASIYTPWAHIEAAGCGHWVDNTPEQIAQATIDLLRHDRAQLRQNALALAKQYEWGEVARQMKQHYQDLISRN